MCGWEVCDSLSVCTETFATTYKTKAHIFSRYLRRASERASDCSVPWLAARAHTPCSQYRNVVVVFFKWSKRARALSWTHERQSKRHTIRDCSLAEWLTDCLVPSSCLALRSAQTHHSTAFILWFHINGIISFVVLHGMRIHSPLILWLSATMRSRFAVPSYSVFLSLSLFLSVFPFIFWTSFHRHHRHRCCCCYFFFTFIYACNFVRIHFKV